jgi:hypothetical protein
MENLAASLSEPPALAGGIQRLLPPANARGSDFSAVVILKVNLRPEAVDFTRVFERFAFAKQVIFRLQ